MDRVSRAAAGTTKTRSFRIDPRLVAAARGATLPRERRWIDELEAQHQVFFPGVREWRRSGTLLQRLRELRGYDAKKLRDLHFDALIALTARAIGAVVITCNGEDFEALRNEEPFELQVWRAR